MCTATSLAGHRQRVRPTWGQRFLGRWCMPVIAPRRVGFLADTHSNKADGSDLPDPVLEAFAGVDLVVHLGDIGRKGILDRLLEVAPVLVPVGGNKGYVPWLEGGGESAEAPVRVIT